MNSIIQACSICWKFLFSHLLPYATDVHMCLGKTLCVFTQRTSSWCLAVQCVLTDTAHLHPCILVKISYTNGQPWAPKPIKEDVAVRVAESNDLWSDNLFPCIPTLEFGRLGEGGVLSSAQLPCGSLQLLLDVVKWKQFPGHTVHIHISPCQVPSYLQDPQVSNLTGGQCHRKAYYDWAGHRKAYYEQTLQWNAEHLRQSPLWANILCPVSKRQETRGQSWALQHTGQILRSCQVAHQARPQTTS